MVTILGPLLNMCLRGAKAKRSEIKESQITENKIKREIKGKKKWSGVENVAY